MQNNVWEFKKQILNSTNLLTLNTDLLSKSGWTKEEIDHRKEILINKIIKLYP